MIRQRGVTGALRLQSRDFVPGLLHPVLKPHALQYLSIRQDVLHFRCDHMSNMKRLLRLQLRTEQRSVALTFLPPFFFLGRSFC